MKELKALIVSQKKNERLDVLSNSESMMIKLMSNGRRESPRSVTEIAAKMIIFDISQF